MTCSARAAQAYPHVPHRRPAGPQHRAALLRRHIGWASTPNTTSSPTGQFATTCARLREMRGPREHWRCAARRNRPPPAPRPRSERQGATGASSDALVDLPRAALCALACGGEAPAPRGGELVAASIRPSHGWDRLAGAPPGGDAALQAARIPTATSPPWRPPGDVAGAAGVRVGPELSSSAAPSRRQRRAPNLVGSTPLPAGSRRRTTPRLALAPPRAGSRRASPRRSPRSCRRRPPGPRRLVQLDAIQPSPRARRAAAPVPRPRVLRYHTD